MFTIFRRCELTLLINVGYGGIKMGKDLAFVNKSGLLIGKIAMAIYLIWYICSILTLFSPFVVCYRLFHDGIFFFS